MAPMVSAPCMLYHRILMTLALPQTDGPTIHVPTTDASSRRAGYVMPSIHTRIAAALPGQ